MELFLRVVESLKTFSSLLGCFVELLEIVALASGRTASRSCIQVDYLHGLDPNLFVRYRLFFRFAVHGSTVGSLTGWWLVRLFIIVNRWQSGCGPFNDVHTGRLSRYGPLQSAGLA